MFNKMKNIKITNIMMFMGAFSVLLTMMVGFLGLYNMQKINSNVKGMYGENLVPISNVGIIRSNFLKIRLEATNASRSTSYSTEYDNNIKSFNDIVQKNTDSFVNSGLNSDETKSMDAFKSNYNEYLSLWGNLNVALSKAEKITPEKATRFGQLGDIIDTSLQNLSDYEIKTADNVKTQSGSIYASSVKVFISTLVIAILVSALVCYIVVKIIKESSKQIIENLETVADCDFTVRVDTTSSNEFGVMGKSLQKTIENISLMVNEIKAKADEANGKSLELAAIAEEMTASSANVSIAIQETAKGTASQAEDLLSINSAIMDFGRELNKVVQSIGNIDKNSKGVTYLANNSGGSMEQLLSSINKISYSFSEFVERIKSLEDNVNKINEITGFINSIANQTNLLALNAAIEAARAGELGRGFSIVADEIRKLAEQSKSSSENITSLIGSTVNHMNNMMRSSETMNKELGNQKDVISITIGSFKEIIKGINEVIPEIEVVNESALNINNEKNGILTRIENSSAISEEIASASQEIAASAEEMSTSSKDVAKASQSLNNMTNGMKKDLNKFKVLTA